MVLQIFSHRTARTARSFVASSHRARPLVARRTIFNWLRGKSSNRPPPLDPLSEDFLKKKKASLPPSAPVAGDLAPSSIFDEADKDQPAVTKPSKAHHSDPSLTAAALDPRPNARRRWERKKVVQSIRKRGRIDKPTLLARTERQHVSKSRMLDTSVKKLMPLARQIAGKTLEEAIVQMRFSPKKVAQDVLKHLEYARNEAIVTKGMGLAKQPLEQEIIDKRGQRLVVQDKSDIYIDQAWVGRGFYGRGYDYRARGRVNILRPPHTSITVLLKEEATRLRESKEREEKRASKKPWVHHPDRPITAQRQYVLW